MDPEIIHTKLPNCWHWHEDPSADTTRIISTVVPPNTNKIIHTITCVTCDAPSADEPFGYEED